MLVSYDDAMERNGPSRKTRRITDGSVVMIRIHPTPRVSSACLHVFNAHIPNFDLIPLTRGCRTSSSYSLPSDELGEDVNVVASDIIYSDRPRGALLK